MATTPESKRRSLFARATASGGRMMSRLRERGFRDTFAWGYYQMQWRWRERSLGISTHERSYGIVYADDGDNNGYEPVDYKCFDNVLDYLQPESQERTLIDYGCGLGRAVVLAGLRPFQRVIGIEWSEELSSLANQHLDKLRDRFACPDVTVVRVDATNYELPPKTNTIFLYNSFTGDVLARVLDRIRESLEKHPRRLDFVYMYPLADGNHLEEIPWLEPVDEISTGFFSHIRTIVYQANCERTAVNEVPQ